MSDQIETSTDIIAYTGAVGGGCVDVATIRFHGCTLIDNNELARLRAGAPEAPTPVLKLTAREFNALKRVRTLAWEAVASQPKDGKHPGSKDQRSVWAAGGALEKIDTYLKGL